MLITTTRCYVASVQTNWTLFH